MLFLRTLKTFLRKELNILRNISVYVASVNANVCLSSEGAVTIGSMKTKEQTVQ